LSAGTGVLAPTIMKHVEQYYSRHTPAQIFDLVVDVEQYPDFVPWVIAAKVIRRQDQTMWTDMTMGTAFLRKRFTTVASLDRPHRVEVNSHDPIFERFQQIWTFKPGAEGGTDVEHQVDLQFRSQILQILIGASYADRTQSMVKAYLRRAQRLYGSAQPLNAQGSTVAGQSNNPGHRQA
jgi:coenzyme Q-binding protein COQ10